jgi:hypothetical protein
VGVVATQFVDGAVVDIACHQTGESGVAQRVKTVVVLLDVDFFQIRRKTCARGSFWCRYG